MHRYWCASWAESVGILGTDTAGPGVHVCISASAPDRVAFPSLPQ